MSDPIPFSLDAMPDDIKGEPSLKDFKTVGDLAKSYVHAAKLTGVDKNHVFRLPADGDYSKVPEIWKTLGKPEKYEYPELKTQLPEPYKAKLAEFADKHNFTKTQWEGLLHFTDGEAVAATNAQQQARAQQRADAETALKEAFGKSFDQTLNFAKNVPEMFGKGALWKKFEDAGLTLDPDFIGLMGDIGRLAGEDTFVSGNGGGFEVSPAQANATINDLMANADFMKVYMTREAPGHKEAVDRIYKLRQIATAG